MGNVVIVVEVEQDGHLPVEGLDSIQIGHGVD